LAIPAAAICARIAARQGRTRSVYEVSTNQVAGYPRGLTLGVAHLLPPVVSIPTFIPTTGRTTSHWGGRLRNIIPAQGTCRDVGERPFGNYDLFEGTEQIQQLVISRAISGVHIR
jgi:hypothetical protein